MAASKKGKITELYDMAAIEAQQTKVIGLLGDLVKTINDVKPISVKLEGAEKTKDVIDGVKNLSQATAQVADTSRTAVNEMGKLVDMGKKVAGSYEQQANLITKFAGTLDQNIKLQTEYKIRLQEITAQFAEYKKAVSDGTLGSEKYRAKLEQLTKEQLELQAASKELGFTIRAQVKDNISAEHSYDALNHRLGLLARCLQAIISRKKEKAVQGPHCLHKSLP
jgi:chromosome segregation ATPase